jgi:hypothetical protein
MQSLIKPPADAFSILAAAWHAWRTAEGASFPARTSVKMQSIGPILPWIILAKLNRGGEAIPSLIGEQLKLIYTQDLTGKSTKSVIPVEPWQAKFHQQVVDSLMEPGQGIIATRPVMDDLYNDWLYQTLSLPLANREGQLGHVIICGTLTPPKDMSNAAWSKYGYLDLTLSHINRVQPIDLGSGVETFEGMPHERAVIDPAISLSALIKA